MAETNSSNALPTLTHLSRAMRIHNCHPRFYAFGHGIIDDILHGTKGSGVQKVSFEFNHYSIPSIVDEGPT